MWVNMGVIQAYICIYNERTYVSVFACNGIRRGKKTSSVVEPITTLQLTTFQAKKRARLNSTDLQTQISLHPQFGNPKPQTLKLENNLHTP